MRVQGLGASEIAKALKIGRASVDRGPRIVSAPLSRANAEPC
jgi:hypothetical protein